MTPLTIESRRPRQFPGRLGTLVVLTCILVGCARLWGLGTPRTGQVDLSAHYNGAPEKGWHPPTQYCAPFLIAITTE